MAEENDPSGKTEEPTPRRLEEARRKGDVAKSHDLPQAASLAAAAGVVALAGGWMARNLTEALRPFIAHPEAMSLHAGGATEVARQAMMASAPILALVLGAAALAGAFGNL